MILFCKHFLVIEFVTEWKQPRMCTTIHLEVIFTPMSGKVSRLETESCEMPLLTVVIVTNFRALTGTNRICCVVLTSRVIRPLTG